MMYQSYFGLSGPPFSIVPDHRVVYMSDSHREAVAHLLHSLKTSGGFVQLTGEVGTGKTTVSRYLLQHLPENVDVALLLNPRINEHELLEAICDELGIQYPGAATQRLLTRLLNLKLLKSHTVGRHTVLIIDEAQNLSREVLEQIRLLTNLETSTDKLLQIILIGQPELVHMLDRHDLRQLSQRIVGRFQLKPLNRRETREYIQYRLKQAGCERRLFTDPAIHRIQRLSGGVPRLINVLCDSALMGAYSENKEKVSLRIVNRAAREVLPQSAVPGGWGGLFRFAFAVPLLITVFGAGLIVAVGQVGAAGWINDLRGRMLQVATPLAAESPPQHQSRSGNGGASTSGIGASDPVATADQKSRFDLIYRLGVPFKND